MIDQPVLRLKIDLSTAGQWDSEHKDTGRVHHNYQWTANQWSHIKKVAMRLFLATWEGTAPWEHLWELAIPPEALDYWDAGLPAGLFSDDPDSEETMNAVATAIGVVDALLDRIGERT